MENGNQENTRQERPSTALERLEERKASLVSTRDKLHGRHRLFIGTFIFLLIILPASAWLSYEIEKKTFSYVFLYGTGYLGLVLGAVFFTRGRLRDVKQDLQDVEFEIDLLEFDYSTRAITRETRAEKLLRINNLQLQRYYNLNLNQNIWVFGLGIFCILIGLGVIGMTFYLVLKTASGDFKTQVITGALGSIGSLFSSSVGAIYLQIHAKATSHLAVFHSRLVETQQLLFGNLLASRIEDNPKRWETLSQLALNISKAGGGPHSSS